MIPQMVRGVSGDRGSTDSKGSAGSTGKVAASPLFYNRRFAPHHNPEPNNLNLELIISLFSKPLNDFLEIHAALFHILIHIERGAGR